MLVQPADRPPVLAVIVAREQPGFVHAREEAAVAPFDRPDLIELAFAAGRIGWSLVDLAPRFEVGTCVEAGAVDLVRRGKQKPSPPGPGGGRNLPAFEQWSLAVHLCRFSSDRQRNAPFSVPTTTRTCMLP